MPPKAVKTIKDLIFWEYAKLISESALHDRKNYAFIMHNFKQLQGGQKKWRECHFAEIHNIVKACRKCNSSKGDKDLIVWYGLKDNMRYRELLWENI